MSYYTFRGNIDPNRIKRDPINRSYGSARDTRNDLYIDRSRSYRSDFTIITVLARFFPRRIR